MNADSYEAFEASAHRCKAAAYRQQAQAHRLRGLADLADKCEAIAVIELDMADSWAELAQRTA